MASLTDHPRKRFQKQFGITKQAAKHMLRTEVDQITACADDSARRLLLDMSEKFEGDLEPERILVKGCTMAYWVEAFARAEMGEIIRRKAGRPPGVPKKPVVSEFIDYRWYRRDWHIEKMVRLSKMVNG